MANSDGTGLLQLSSQGLGAFFPSWSVDGRNIRYRVRSGTEVRFFRADAAGGNTTEVTQQSDREPEWGQSKDGKWVFVSSAPEGQRQVWKKPLAGGRSVLVWRGIAANPLHSPDGRFLYFVDREFGPGSLWRLTIETDEVVKMIEEVSNSSNFKPTTEGLNYVSTRQPDGRYYVMFLGYATKSKRAVVPLTAQPAYGLDVSPDGEWLLFTQYDSRGCDLMLVENFR